MTGEYLSKTSLDKELTEDYCVGVLHSEEGLWARCQS